MSIKAQVDFHPAGHIKSLTFDAKQGDIANLLLCDGHSYSTTIQMIMDELYDYYFEDVTYNEKADTITLNMVKI